MAIAYQLGSFYFQRIGIKPSSPFIHMAPTHEMSEPYRFGRAAIVHYWPGRAVVIGWWTGKHESEDSALMAGMQAREDELVDDSGQLLDRYKTRQDARKTLAKNSADLDEEWEIINTLALLEDDRDDFQCNDDEEDDGCDCSSADDDFGFFAMGDDEEEDR